MVAALELEIKAIKKRGGSSTLEVTGGKFKGKCDNGYLYVFPVSTETYLRDDSPIKIVVGKDEVDGTVVSFGEGILVISVEQDFGPRIPFARIVSDDSFLTERLRDKLKEVSEDIGDFNSETANQVIGERHCNTSHGIVDERVFLGGEPLNEEQKCAVTKAIGSDITYIWGPPGTGKTTVLARIVEAYYYAGLSVLLVSNTNIAVDTALEKIAERLKSDEGFQKGLVLRHGPIVKYELDRDYGDRVEIEKVVSRLGERLTQQKSELESKKNAVQNQSALYRETVNDWHKLNDSQSHLDNLSKSLEHSQTKKRSTNFTLESLDTEIKSLKEDLQSSLKMGSIRKFFSGVNSDKIRTKLVGAEAKCSANQSVLAELEKEILSFQTKIPYYREQVRNLKSIVANYPPCSECKKSLEELENEVSGIDKSLSEIQKQLDELRSQVVNNCKILATTIYRTYLKAQIERKFDVVVIDEASMLALPMSYYGAGRANKHVVVAGDFRQLPPIIMSDDGLAEEWLKQDVFYKAGIVRSVEKGNYPDPLVALKKQYRMTERICDVINEMFYDDHPLETVLFERGSETGSFPYEKSDLLYLDTKSYHPWTSMRVGTYSRYNLFHALVIRNFVYSLYKGEYLTDNRRVGIISPYSAQARLVEKLVNDHIDDRDHIAVSTVHRFQGNEKDVIIIDITDSLGTRPSKFVRAIDRKEDGARLLNVALSRAKSHIILVANFDYLRQKISSESVIRRVANLFLERGVEINIATVLPLGPGDWINGLRNLESATFDFDDSKSGIFNEGTFFAAFKEDLLMAENSVVIFSPFLTQNGTGRLMTVISHKISQGIQVRLVTRPPGDQGGILEEGLEDIVHDMTDTGVAVDFRTRMHEKFAIVDKKILWYGSLNIFSHRDTSESMFRIVSPSICEQMVQFVVGAYGKKKEEKSDVNFADKENPNCPNCSKPMIWKNGRYGVYFECSACGTKSDPRRSRPGRRGTTGNDGPKSEKKCVVCGKQMRKRKGKYGWFWGCTGYPKCKHTESA
ncbi:MAG TPA: AAA domain-containing protein [Sedimentisphaerales bacterium]|nr:AAA domain-containing protein [Sedimentisphaerales bacterium]